MSDHTGARLLIEKLPAGSTLIGDRGYDSDHFRTALNERGIKACIPPTKNRKQPIDYDKALTNGAIRSRTCCQTERLATDRDAL